MTVSVLDLWKRHNGHRGRSATGQAAAPALQPARTGYPLLDAASRWGPTTGLSHDRQCRASRSRRAAPAVGGDCRLRYPRPVLLEGGWTVAELAGRTVRAAAVCQCGAPHVSTGQSLGHRNSPSEFSDPERIEHYLLQPRYNAYNFNPIFEKPSFIQLFTNRAFTGVGTDWVSSSTTRGVVTLGL